MPIYHHFAHIATRVRPLVCVFLLLVAADAFAQELPESQVPPAIQKVRWAMLDADVNALTFRSMDRIFNTRLVGRSGPVWELPQTDHELDFSYEFAGQTFTAEEGLERNFTNALMVMKNGRVVTEIYRNLSNQQSHFMSWSMAKSITSLLVGIALHEGKIESLDDDIVRYLPELKDGAYNGVTVRQVLEMQSGVDYEERYDFENPGIAAKNHELALILNVARFADMAVGIEQASTPGSEFVYKTIDTAVLGWLLERATGMNASAYMSSRIWEPLGAESNGFFIIDGPPAVGREFTGGGFNATLRDYARLGQMVLNGGSANGHQIVPQEWVEESTRPADPETPLGGYGYQWWTVLESNAFYAAGLQGQFIYIDPDTQTVVVKLSYFPPGDEAAYGEALAFLAAIASWTP